MVIEEIVFGTDIKDKQKAIQDNFGKEVILNDFHNLWCHGILLKDGSDNVVYRMNILNETNRERMEKYKREEVREPKRLHYHDLKQLLILKPYKLK